MASLIDVYTQSKKEHEEMCHIIDESGLEQNSRYLHTHRLNDIYHEVAFSFNTKKSNRHSYDKSKRLSEYIAKACEHFMDEILEMAKVKSEQDLLLRAKNATEEANAVLEAVR